ncbi:hypothetical protein ABZ413_24515 [Nocardia rhamnosiphila]|uniref:hypothetical protein n=1 Tax=Nocardia rhamnosiphila TaxID=426716 RepID=UPI0034041B25
MSGYRRVLETRDPATCPDRLRQLAVDPVRPVRLWAARNPNTPADALTLLVVDEDSSVQWNAIVNPVVPVEALRRVAAIEAARWGNRHLLLRERVVHHPNVTDELRAELINAGTCQRVEWCPKPWFYRNRFDDSHLPPGR